MADDPEGSRGGQHIFCHLCQNEWHTGSEDLTCPRCNGEITEIITPENDPREDHTERRTPPPDLHDLRGHYPFTSGSDSDPDEADIEEHVTHGPGGSVFFSQTIRNSRPPNIPFNTRPRRRGPFPEDDPDHVMSDFQHMLGTLMGPGLRPGQTGRSGPDTLFTTHTQTHSTPGGTSFTTTTRGNVVGGRITFTSGPIRPRDADGPQPGGMAGPQVEDLVPYASPPSSPHGRSILLVSIRATPDQLASLLGNIFGNMAPAGANDHENARGPGMPAPFQGLLQSLLNPANARHGDAVYSQEALDQIISTLMEQHPASNAPGPASPDAIASLPKKKIDEKMLGPEGKAECSVCMDEVQLNEEVVSLPCSHWFHETCATMWLSEHNTCPICRKGIDSDSNPQQADSHSPRAERRSSRISLSRPRLSRSNTSSRNEARLDAIRNTGRLSPTDESRGLTTPSSTRRWRVVGNSDDSDPSRDMPGSFSSFTRYRDERDDNRRDSIRGTTSSGSEQSRSSRRSSRSDTTGNGPMNWLRDRFGSGRRSHD